MDYEQQRETDREDDVTNLDDASLHYGLSHNAEGAGAGGGINRHIEQQRAEIEENEKRRREERRALERRVRDHNLEVERTGKGEKWAMPAEEASNAKAYELVERRIRDLQADGLTYFEASQIARREADEGRNEKSEPACIGSENGCHCKKCNAVTAEFLASKKRVHSGGGRGNKTKFVRAGGAVVAEVQQMGAKAAGSGGSSGGGIKSKKRSRPICKNCHLEICTCGVDPSENASRPYFCHKCGKRSSGECVCYSGRTEDIPVKVSKKAKSRLRSQDDVSAGQIVEAVCIAAERSGLTIAQTLAVFEGLTKDDQFGQVGVIILGTVREGDETHHAVQRGLVTGTLCGDYRWNSGGQTPSFAAAVVSCRRCKVLARRGSDPVKRGKNRAWWPGAGRGRQLNGTGTRQLPWPGFKEIGRVENFSHPGHAKDVHASPVGNRSRAS